MSLRPDKKPAQQLMSMLWSEQHAYFAADAYGKIFVSTGVLIERGYVVKVGEYQLEVALTPAGRAEAERLMATEAGQKYMAEVPEGA